MLFVYCIIATLDNLMKSERELSTNGRVSPLNIRDQVQ